MTNKVIAKPGNIKSYSIKHYSKEDKCDKTQKHTKEKNIKKIKDNKKTNKANKEKVIKEHKEIKEDIIDNNANEIQSTLANETQVVNTNIQDTCTNISESCTNISESCTNISESCTNIAEHCINIPDTSANISNTCANISDTSANILNTCANISDTYANILNTVNTTITAPHKNKTEKNNNSSEEVLKVKFIKFIPQEVLYYNRVNAYFKMLEEKKFKHMVDILNGEADISLRLLEWFITKYCDKYKTTKCEKENGESFVIFVGYKAALKSYRKRYFDPFKRNLVERKQKFCYICNKNGNEYKVNTTLGQLHFFRWLFENNILDHIIENLDTIKASMEHTNRLEKKRKDEDKKNGVKKNKNKNQHKKINKSNASSSVEITTSDSKSKSSLIISFD